MGLDMIVAVKQVPDTADITGEAMKPDGTVNREALPAIVNPEDLNALEAALRLKEKHGGSITVITMGPPSAAETLKECYYRGADDLILLTDRGFAASDTLATSYALKRTIDRIGKFHIVFCGRQAIDGDTAQVGPQLAEKLGINQLTGITGVISSTDGPDGSILVKRATEYGHEILESRFPVLLTITGAANNPRSPGAKRLMAYKDTSFSPVDDRDNHFKEWNIQTIQADPSRCGLCGSPTRVQTIESVVLTASNLKKIAATQEGISDLIGELKADHIIG